MYAFTCILNFRHAILWLSAYHSSLQLCGNQTYSCSLQSILFVSYNYFHHYRLSEATTVVCFWNTFRFVNKSSCPVSPSPPWLWNLVLIKWKIDRLLYVTNCTSKCFFEVLFHHLYLFPSGKEFSLHPLNNLSFIFAD